MTYKARQTLQDAFYLWWEYWSRFVFPSLLLWIAVLVPYGNFAITGLLTASLLLQVTLNLAYELNEEQNLDFTFRKYWHLILFQLIACAPVLIASIALSMSLSKSGILVKGLYFATFVLLDVFKAFPLSGAIGIALAIGSDAHTATEGHVYAVSLFISLIISTIGWAVPYLILDQDLTLMEALQVSWQLTKRYSYSFFKAFALWQIVSALFMAVFALGLWWGSAKDNQRQRRGKESSYVVWILLLFVIILVFAFTPTSVLFWTITYFKLVDSYMAENPDGLVPASAPTGSGSSSIKPFRPTTTSASRNLAVGGGILLALLMAGYLYYQLGKKKSIGSSYEVTDLNTESTYSPPPEAGDSSPSSPQWQVYTKANSALPYDGLSSILADENDQIWLGTFGGGLARLRNGKWTVYNSANSDLPNDRIYCLTKASDGTLWIGTFGGGLAQFDGEEWRVYNTSNSPLPHDKVLCLAASEDGTLWIGTAGGLARKQGEEWFVYTTENSLLPNNEVKSLLLTSDGGVWVGTAKGLACLKGEEWSLYTAETVSWPSYDIQALASNRKGEIWIGTWGGGLIRLKNENWRVYSTANSALPQDYIVALALDSEGALWIGTREKGLAYCQDGEWKVYRTANSELPDNHVYALAIDSRQNVWAGTWKGVACLRREAQ